MEEDMEMQIKYAKKDKYPVQEITTGFLPRTVTIPLSQEDNFVCESIVKEGDEVKEGQVIAEASREVYGAKAFGVAKIHAPIPGKILGIKNCSYPNGKQGKAIEILLSGSFSYLGKQQSQADFSTYSPAMLLKTVSDAGVINTFSTTSYSAFELDVNKIKNEQNKKLFIRLFDEDPSCDTDTTLTRSDFDKIMTGIYITSKICDVNEIVIAYPKASNLETMFNLSQKEMFESIPMTFLECDSNIYPAGGKRELSISYIKQKKLAASFEDIMRSCFFTDSSTMVHVYDAVVLKMPLETINVFVDGDCLQAKALLKVCVGTSFKAIAKQCGGFVKKLGKIIVNGEINGVAVNSLDTPVTKYVKSITFTSHEDSFDRSVSICLRCGRCRSVCKTGLSPDIIFAKVITGAVVDEAYIQSVDLCTQCGLCSANCPSKLPLAKIIKLLREERYQNEK